MPAALVITPVPADHAPPLSADSARRLPAGRTRPPRPLGRTAVTLLRYTTAHRADLIVIGGTTAGCPGCG
jgi:hypothetical protein